MLVTFGRIFVLSLLLGVLYVSINTPSPWVLRPPATLSYKEIIDDGSFWMEEQKRRHFVMREACKNYDKKTVSFDFLVKHRSTYLENFIYDDRHKVIYCYIPKVACTNWKRIMMILGRQTNKTNPLDIPTWLPHEMNSLHRLSNPRLKGTLIVKRLLSYRKFLFVRHPVERLISAFANKLQGNNTSSKRFWEDYVSKIKSLYRNKMLDKGDNDDELQFGEFVRFLTDPKVSEVLKSNEHWNSFEGLCHPCLIKYDFVGKYESLHEDAEEILKRIRAPLDLHFPPMKPSFAQAVATQYLNKVSVKHFQRLIDRYMADFEIFGYDSDFILSDNNKTFSL